MTLTSAPVPRLLAHTCLSAFLMLSVTAGIYARPLPRHKAATKKVAVVAPLLSANDVALQLPVASGATGPAVLRLQILLDRARFSSGEIDGRYGSTLASAVATFNRAHKFTGTTAGPSTWQALAADTAPVLGPYTITAEDVAGPFVPLPAEMADKAALTALGFENVAEELGEKFHASPALLKALNPKAAFQKAGEVITVPLVTRAPLTKEMVASIRVSKSRRTVEALDAAGAVLASYPATTGSEHDPLPIGAWKINGVAWNPSFNYNPELFWDADAKDQKAKIPAGPNNPVGVVWIDLSKPHYGIHGTPVPAAIGKTTSHGCIRLTNWDVTELAKAVKPGTPASLEP